MALKALLTGIRLDKDCLDFLREVGIFRNNSDRIRFAIKFMRLYSIPAIRAIKEKIKD